MTNIRTARLLMALTILLLTAFQVYWLNKLYKEEYSNIKRNTNVLFRDCLYKLQVDRFKKDTLFGKLPGDNLFTVDILNILKTRLEDSASSPHRTGKKIYISVNTHIDTILHQGLPGNESLEVNDSYTSKDSVKSKFIIRKNDGHDFMKSFHDSTKLNDSIPIAVIDSAFRKSLSDSKLDLSYSILKVDLKKDPGICNGAFCTSTVPMGLFGLTGYRASFNQPYFKIIRSIGAQFLLSAVMIGLTLLSFIFIYRGLLQQQRLAEIKNEFISNITHELKTPISTVSVAIEAIKNFNASNNPERTSEYLNIADNELKRLTLLVDKVLKLSIFEQDKVELKYEVIDVKTLLSGVLTSMKLQFEKYKADVTMEAEQEDLLIYGDRLHITGVFYNLLDNALKYSVEKPAVLVQIMKREGYITVKISDNGIGIPPGLKDKIFEKFFRVPHGDAHDAPGYGLGLSYVMHVIKQHKGSITVQTDLGKGSSFNIKIPEYHG